MIEALTHLCTPVWDCVRFYRKLSFQWKSGMFYSLKIWIFGSVLLLFVHVFVTMDTLEEQRSVIKFFFKSGATTMECWQQMHQAYGDRTVTPKTVRVWMKKFGNGVQGMKDRPRSGHPRSARSPANIQMVLNAIQANRRTTVEELSAATNVSKSSVHTIIKKDIKFSKLALKFMPCLLTDEQKQFRVRMCELNLQSLKDDDQFLSKIITGDESWVSIFEMELKANSWEWHPRGESTSRPLKAIRNRSAKKAMLTVFSTRMDWFFPSSCCPGRQSILITIVTSRGL